MRRLFLTLAVAAMASLAMAVPAKRITDNLRTTYGTVVEVQLVGDEFGHWYVDAQNNHYTMQDGLLKPLTEAAFSQQKLRADNRRKERNELYITRNNGARRAPERAQMLNISPRGLLILVNFSDKQFQASNSHAEMDSMLNGHNYSYDISIGSAREYFYAQSGGLYNPQFDVVGPVTLPQTMAYYGGNGSGGEGDDSKLGDMVLHACSIASQVDGIDFRNYDNNNDGKMDFVYLIYAGYGEADGGGDNTIWPASWDMASAILAGYTSLNSEAYYNTANYSYDGVVIGSFAYSAELNYYNSCRYPTRGYTRSNPMRAGIGTFCHEFSHVIGLPDYYDTEYGTNYDNNLTPGLWSLMDGGSYNEDGEVPPSYSIYDKYFVGWATPTLLNTACDDTLQADGFSGRYITSNGSVATPTTTNTVYYLENRQQSGWDKGLPGHGMLVWKVNYDQSAWEANIVNNTDNNPLVTYIPADNIYSDYQGDSGDPFPGTSSVTSYNGISNYQLSNISEANGVVTFHFGEKYNIGFYGTMCNITGDATECIESGTTWSGTINAFSGYKLCSVVVSMGGSAVANAVTFATDSLSASVRFQVTANATITAIAQKTHHEGIFTCEDYSWTATTTFGNQGEAEMEGRNWMLTYENTDSYYWFEDARGAQFGSARKPAGKVALTTDSFQDCLLDKLVINASTGANGDGKLSVFINGTQLERSVALASTAADYTFENSANLQGEVEIRLTNTTKAVYLKSINITLKDGPTPPSGLEETAATKARKYMRDGRLVIELDGKTYDILGNIIR